MTLYYDRYKWYTNINILYEMKLQFISMLYEKNIMYTAGMAWQLLRTLSILPCFVLSSPHRSSPTGKTSGPQPDLPCAPLLLASPPPFTCRDPLKYRPRDSSDPPLALYLSKPSLQTNKARCAIL